ncbi:hypothetical protein SUDANB108_00035 [Streptomyces sp. enrichment culture]
MSGERLAAAEPDALVLGLPARAGRPDRRYAPGLRAGSASCGRWPPSTRWLPPSPVTCHSGRPSSKTSNCTAPPRRCERHWPSRRAPDIGRGAEAFRCLGLGSTGRPGARSYLSGHFSTLGLVGTSGPRRQAGAWSADHRPSCWVNRPASMRRSSFSSWTARSARSAWTHVPRAAAMAASRSLVSVPIFTVVSATRESTRDYLHEYTSRRGMHAHAGRAKRPVRAVLDRPFHGEGQHGGGRCPGRVRQRLGGWLAVPGWVS